MEIGGHVVYWLGALADWWTTRRGLKKGAREVGGFGGLAKLMRVVGRDWALTLVKGGIWGGFYWYGMPAGVFYMAGGVQFLAALGNYFDWWGGVFRWLKAKLPFLARVLPVVLLVLVAGMAGCSDASDTSPGVITVPVPDDEADDPPADPEPDPDPVWPLDCPEDPQCPDEAPDPDDEDDEDDELPDGKGDLND